MKQLSTIRFPLWCSFLIFCPFGSSIHFLVSPNLVESAGPHRSFSWNAYSSGTESFYQRGLLKLVGQPRLAPKDQIQFVDISQGHGAKPGDDEFPRSFYLEVPFRMLGENAGMVIFAETPVSHTIRVKHHSHQAQTVKGHLVKEVEFAHFSEIGTVDLQGNGDDLVFIVMEDGGTGFHQKWLVLLNPQISEIVEVELGFSHDVTEPITDFSPSQNFYKPEFRTERLFLEELKFGYGFLSEDEVKAQQSNPAFAYYYWKQDNGDISNGPMRIRRYKGGKQSDEVEGDLEIGQLVYHAQFKAGVVAYDQQTDEHYVLFHPDDMYHWPSVLERMGSYLLIGTYGEGLAVVNLETFHLQRIVLGGDNESVQRIDILGRNTIRINDSLVLDLDEHL